MFWFGNQIRVAALALPVLLAFFASGCGTPRDPDEGDGGFPRTGYTLNLLIGRLGIYNPPGVPPDNIQIGFVNSNPNRNENLWLRPLQLGLFNNGYNLLRIGLVNNAVAADVGNGLGLGVLNSGAGIQVGIFGLDGYNFQLGLLNLGNGPVQIGIFSARYFGEGFQLGLLNSAGVADSGVQLGLMNIGSRRACQIGFFNYANNGVQVGLLNFSARAPWLMPLVISN